MKLIKEINLLKVQDYLERNKDKSIQDVYNYIKSLKLKNRTTEQNIVFTYLYLNRKKLRLK